MMNKGYDQRGRPKNEYFATLDEARKEADYYFRKRGVVLGITAVIPKASATATGDATP